MRSEMSKISPGREPPWSEAITVWFEQEDPEEVRKIEEQKKKQKALEKALAEQRKKEQGQKAPRAIAN